MGNTLQRHLEELTATFEHFQCCGCGCTITPGKTGSLNVINTAGHIHIYCNICYFAALRADSHQTTPTKRRIRKLRKTPLPC